MQGTVLVSRTTFTNARRSGVSWKQSVHRFDAHNIARRCTMAACLTLGGSRTRSLTSNVRLDASDVAAITSRGKALKLLDQADQALAAYDRALALDPAYHDAIHGRADVILEPGRPEEALAEFARALEISRSSSEAIMDLQGRGHGLHPDGPVR